MGKRSRRRKKRKEMEAAGLAQGAVGAEPEDSGEGDGEDEDAASSPPPEAKPAEAAAVAKSEPDPRETSAAKKDRDNVVPFPAKGPSPTPVPGRLTGAAVAAARSDAVPAAELTPPPIRAMEQQFYDTAPEEGGDDDLETEREPLPRAMWVALVIVGLAVLSGAGLLVWRYYWQIQPVPLVGEEDDRGSKTVAHEKATKRTQPQKATSHEDDRGSDAVQPATTAPEPASAGPDTAEPASAVPATTEPVATAAPQTAEPATTAPASTAPASAGESAERLAKLLKQGDALNRNGAGGGALKKFQEALTLDEANAHAHAGISMAYLSMNRNADALTAAQRAIALDPNEVQANFVVGYVQRRTDPAAARAALERCVAARDRTWSGECRGLLAGLR